DRHGVDGCARSAPRMDAGAGESCVISLTIHARDFEKKTLYKSNIIWDKSETLGHPFVVFYNGKQQGPGTERIGIAVSNDMIHWSRFGSGPVIDNGPKGISGDPQIVRIDDLWVMFCFV